MMKLAARALLLTAVVACAPAEEPVASPDEESAASAAEQPGAAPISVPPAGSVRHVVVFRFRPDAPEAQIQEVTDAFRGLQEKIPGILAFEHGANHSPEGKDQGFNHVYTITFENAAARDAYLPHPDHAAFGQLLGRLNVHEDVFVVDYDPQP